MPFRNLLAATLAAAVLATPASAAGRRRPRTPVKPAPVVEAGIVVDTHCDTPSEYLQRPFDLGVWNATGQFDYARMKAGGLDAEFFAAYVPAKYAGRGAAAYCLTIMETIHMMVHDYPSMVRLATSSAEIRSIVKDGRRAILIGIEGGHAIEESLDLLRAFYRFGARYMTLTHTNSNTWADSSGDAGRNNGLTDFGRQVIGEMNRLGMMVDVSHVSDKTFWDTIAVSKAPVIASHSSARVLCDNPRNMTDEMLAAVGKSHGVVMVNFYPSFLSNEVMLASRERDRKLAPRLAELKVEDPTEGEVYTRGVKALMEANPLPSVSWTAIVDHIDHIAKVAGIDSVGIGSDFDGIPMTPAGMEDVSKLPRIRAELKARGYTDAGIRKIMGENFMRVFADVEKVAKQLQSEAVIKPPAK